MPEIAARVSNWIPTADEERTDSPGGNVVNGAGGRPHVHGNLQHFDQRQIAEIEVIRNGQIEAFGLQPLQLVLSFQNLLADRHQRGHLAPSTPDGGRRRFEGISEGIHVLFERRPQPLHSHHFRQLRAVQTVLRSNFRNKERLKERRITGVLVAGRNSRHCDPRARERRPFDPCT